MISLLFQKFQLLWTILKEVLDLEIQKFKTAAKKWPLKISIKFNCQYLGNYWRYQGDFLESYRHII